MPLWDSDRILFSKGDVMAPVEHWSQREHLDRYRWAISRLPRQSRVLDVGCGVGYGAFLMAEAGAAEVVAVDRDAETLAFAALTFRHERVQYVKTDIENEQFLFQANEFDAVTAFEILEHLEHLEAVVRNIASCLVPRGLLFCSAPVIPTMETNKCHKQEFTPKSFRELIRTQFLIYETLTQNEWIQVLSAFRLGNGVEPRTWPDGESVVR
jgi:2-polyprenyl-3-methyl-5-hydroxy-6-metoxy-1,4-benzoquinol methylase